MKLFWCFFLCFFCAQAFADSKACLSAIKSWERRLHIPKELLLAVANTESGRRDLQSGKMTPWPWTINVEGKGYFFRTKQEAVATVKSLLSKGVKSIDVGCGQINLKYHPQAFSSVDDAFDPEKNIAYAAVFMKDLADQFHSWDKAVARYHSANHEHYLPYQKKVISRWQHYQSTPQLQEIADLAIENATKTNSPLLHHPARHVEVAPLPLVASLESPLKNQSKQDVKVEGVQKKQQNQEVALRPLSEKSQWRPLKSTSVQVSLNKMSNNQVLGNTKNLKFYPAFPAKN